MEIKEKIETYWTKRSGAFAKLRLKELQSNKAERWSLVLKRHILSEKPLKLLDIGTGTGFFAILLAKMGHEVTGIDLTLSMIECAKRQAMAYSVFPSFYVMDAEHLAFPEETFDGIVARNLTWTLPHMDIAYREWLRVLKPGGFLLNFDAEYGKESYMYNDRSAKHHAHAQVSEELLEECQAISAAIEVSKQDRPDWDERLLTQAGFYQIQINYDDYRAIYKERDIFYIAIPLFTIMAFKRAIGDML